jgi:hypothetical protein
MNVYTANFGRGNWYWPDCLKHSTITVQDGLGNVVNFPEVVSILRKQNRRISGGFPQSNNEENFKNRVAESKRIPCEPIMHVRVAGVSVRSFGLSRQTQWS